MKVARRAPIVLAILLLAIPMRVHAQMYAGQLGVGVYTPSPYIGPIAPDFGGDTGLFTSFPRARSRSVSTCRT
jgi:hypothetical protein